MGEGVEPSFQDYRHHARKQLACRPADNAKMNEMKPFLCLLFALSLAAEPLAQRERDYAMSALHASRKALHDAVATLSEAQWKFKAAPGRWSIAEITEHVADTEPFLFGYQQMLLKQPAKPALKELAKGNDEAILKAVTSREQKAQAPPQLAPKSKYAAPAQALAAFNAERLKTIRYAESSPDPMRDHLAENFGPSGKPMDAYQFLLMLAAHTDRHVAQINEVKAAAGFPKK